MSELTSTPFQTRQHRLSMISCIRHLSTRLVRGYRHQAGIEQSNTLASTSWSLVFSTRISVRAAMPTGMLNQQSPVCLSPYRLRIWWTDLSYYRQHKSVITVAEGAAFIRHRDASTVLLASVDRAGKDGGRHHHLGRSAQGLRKQRRVESR